VPLQAKSEWSPRRESAVAGHALPVPELTKQEEKDDTHNRQEDIHNPRRFTAWTGLLVAIEKIKTPAEEDSARTPLCLVDFVDHLESQECPEAHTSDESKEHNRENELFNRSRH
jgi:hypothetical protein